VPPTPKSTIETIFPPQSAIDIRPITDTRTARFLVADWVSWSVANVEVATWSASGGLFSKIDSQKFAYVGAGDQVSLSLPTAPIPQQILAICIAYAVNSHKVEAIHFFSTFQENTYRRLRETISEVDGEGKLCSSMPRPAQVALQ
jgi:hypothetical protein